MEPMMWDFGKLTQSTGPLAMEESLPAPLMTTSSARSSFGAMDPIPGDSGLLVKPADAVIKLETIP